MKENKEIMNEKIEKIGITAIECLNGKINIRVNHKRYR